MDEQGHFLGCRGLFTGRLGLGSLEPVGVIIADSRSHWAGTQRECSPRRRALLLEVSIDDWKSSYTGPRMSLTVVISEQVKAVGSTGEEKDAEKYAGAQSRPCQRQFSCRKSQV